MFYYFCCQCTIAINTNKSVSDCLEDYKPVFCRNEQRNMCNYDRGQPGPDWSFLLYRNCFCDDLCAVYGDCCEDYRRNTTSTGQPVSPLTMTPLPPDTFVCAPVDGVYSYGVPIYTVTKCPKQWKDDEISALCEKDPTGDVFLSLPVSGSDSNILYKNVFCSHCHGEVDVVFWKANFTCKSERKDRDEGDPAKIIEAMMGESRNNCFTTYSHPTEPRGYRFCKPNIKRCDVSFEDNCVRDMCETGKNSYLYYDRKVIYKNEFCAMCNNVKTSSLKCYDKVTKFSPLLITGGQPPHKIYPLSLVLDLNSGSGRILDYRVGQVAGPPINDTTTNIHTCNDQYLYDPFTARCRAVYCPDGQLLDGDNCALDCPRVALDKNEYTMYNNGSIYAMPFAHLFKSDEYRMKGNSVLVCSDLEQNYTENITSIRYGASFKFSGTQSIVSAVGQSLSIIALVIHFIVYVILPSLRNLPGKNLMCLVFSLFWAQLLFLVGAGRTEVPTLCTIIAVLTHFFFLCAFCWMSVMAFDIRRTFTTKSAHHGLSGSSKLFIKYSLYAWLTPSVIVLIGIILDVSTVSDQYRPGYGNGVCWITSRMALLLLFALPLAALLIADIVFYVMTVVSIYKVSKVTEMVQQNQSDKTRFLLYVKLSLIMGLTWIFGFIAASTDGSFLWYVFIILNTLQGLFICLAFVFTQKVLKLLKETFVKSVRRETDSTKSTVTKRTSLSTSAQQNVISSGKMRTSSMTSLTQHCTNPAMLKEKH